MLELSLPERIELVQLLDLAAEYLHLDCVYDAERIGNQIITLKLSSKLRSEMRVKDLYSLLETVLKFKGLVMTRREGNLVTIVPAAEALEIDPALVDLSDRVIEAGDMVVTRIFELRHVEVSSVTNLLQSMKLSVAVSPLPETQTLFVHASRKNQDWLADLIEKLDKRRSQVLIDATLVEVTEAESFTYDLNLIQSFPDLTATSGLTGQIMEGVTSADILDRLAASGRDQFIDLQSDRGKFTGFYGDEDIHILLQAMQSKNYGRVLAKPKLLVNDNEPGTIKTMDTTYVPIASSIPVSTGGGENATLVQTELQYQSYEAGITLDITPHISEGNLLRLDIALTRSDFLETEDPERPPNTRSNEVTTTVTVPDGSTIILGGLLKANQNKGGTKVPILGDIPLLGGPFRSINNRDTQSKLYIFVKAEIIRPAGVLAQGMDDLKAISERNRIVFEEHEAQFQRYEDWPGIKSTPVQPEKVLEAH